MENTDKKFISLKEAAELSGYTPDYVGQLIRSGRLEGKKVFSNVAWVTTEKALRAYLARSQKQATGSEAEKLFSSRTKLMDYLLAPEQVTRVYTWALWFIILILAALALFLSYAFAIGIDRHIEERSLDKAAYDL